MNSSEAPIESTKMNISNLYGYIDENLSASDPKALRSFKTYIKAIEEEIMSIKDVDERKKILDQFAQDCNSLLNTKEKVVVSLSNYHTDDLPFTITKIGVGFQSPQTNTFKKIVADMRKYIDDNKLEQRGHWGIGLKKIERRNQRSYKAGPVYIHLGSKTNGGTRRRRHKRTARKRRKAR